MTTTELKAPDYKQANTECGSVKRVWASKKYINLVY